MTCRVCGALLLHATVRGLAGESALVSEWNQLHGASFLLERTTDGTWLLSIPGVFRGHFLEIEHIFLKLNRVKYHHC